MKLELLAAVRKLEKLDVSMETLEVSIDSKGTRYGGGSECKPGLLFEVQALPRALSL